MPNTRQPDNPEADRKLISALIAQDTRGAEQALREGASVNAFDAKNDRTALMIAAEQGMVWEISQLIEGGADVNAKNSKGKTAMEYALNRSAKYMHEIDDEDGQVKFLGAKLIAESPMFDPNIPLTNGKSVLRYASMRGATDVIDVVQDKLGNPAPEEPVATNTAKPSAPKMKV
jgi:ankyrin repeat protein